MNDEFPFYVWTDRTVRTGAAPYFLRWSKSAKSLATKWKKRYGITPVKVQAARWDMETGTYAVDPDGEIWEPEK